MSILTIYRQLDDAIFTEGGSSGCYVDQGLYDLADGTQMMVTSSMGTKLPRFLMRTHFRLEACRWQNWEAVAVDRCGYEKVVLAFQSTFQKEFEEITLHYIIRMKDEAVIRQEIQFLKVSIIHYSGDSFSRFCMD